LILNKALSQSPEAGKLYSVRWLGVLARIRAPSFAQYGVEFLVEQLRDPSLQVMPFITNIVSLKKCVASICAQKCRYKRTLNWKTPTELMFKLAISFFDFCLRK
jgi:hypothetical protein